MFDSIFAEIVWIDKLHYFRDGIYFSDNDCHRSRKKEIFQLSYEEEKLCQKLESYRFKAPLQKLDLWDQYRVK